MTARAASLAWFARHELKLFWRDWVSMLTAGKRRREPLIAIIFLLFVAFVHGLAYVILLPYASAGIVADKASLVVITGSLFLSATLMLSQAMESVTRAFYARADLDLILSSPASARRVFAVRMGAITIATGSLTTVLAGPFINVLAVLEGPRWLAAYGALAALGALATAFAVVLTVGLFRALGPKRTRLISQIVSAVVGAAFVIGVQAVAILSTGSFSRLALFRSDAVIEGAPDLASALWLPARAVMGDGGALAIIMICSFAILGFVIWAFSARFGDHVIAAAGIAFEGAKKRLRRHPFRGGSVKSALRRKEWALLRRDPWLLSQTLMQVLYLLPPALLLWRNFGDRVDALLVMVPVIVMASGQLAGGLAWLAISGEDAPDLVASAPIRPRALLRAKIEAVFGAVAMVVAPLLFALALAAPLLAAVAALGIAIAAGSGTMIQIWFRAQAKRTNFRRRQTSSRIATLAEALSSILWAGTAALAAAGSWFALAIAAIAIIGLTGTWAIRPKAQAGA
ncbi:MAG: permease [Pseudomonadota bacterium]